MTISPQFTPEELRLIADALALHADQIRKAHDGKLVGDALERVLYLNELRKKAASLARQGER